MEIINLSAEPIGVLHSWLPHGLDAEKVVFLPDACPGKSPLPTGTAVHTRQEDWRRFAVSDCGCGMRLMKSDIDPRDLNLRRWDKLAGLLQKNKGGLGDLGGGNHFLDALEPYEDGPVYFLVHTGSRNESGHVDRFVDKHDQFDGEFDRVVEWAHDNRSAIHEAIQATFGKVELVIDLPHNTYERLSDGSVIIRKGSVHIQPGELSILPSHMSGDVLLVRAKETVDGILNSISHGTGRKMSRSECKPHGDAFDFGALRERILIPTSVQDASLRTEGPFAYRDLDECMGLIEDYVEAVSRFSVVGYMGHL